MKAVMTPIQVAEQADRKSSVYLLSIWKSCNAFNKQRWKLLNAQTLSWLVGTQKKQQAKNVSRMLFVASTASDERRQLTPDELAVIKQDLKLDDTEFAIWQQTERLFTWSYERYGSYCNLQSSSFTYCPKGKSKSFVMLIWQPQTPALVWI